MNTQPERGHAKNVGNFKRLISFANGYGTDYNPSKIGIRVINLQALYDNAKNAMSAVSDQKSIYDRVTNDRQLAFEPLSQLSTRLVAALSGCEVTDKTIADARGFQRKIHGSRAIPKPKKPLDTTPPAPAEDAEIQEDELPSEKSISASQRSYDQLAKHFEDLFFLLKNEPNYTPNEVPFKIVTLSALLQSLNDANNAVIDVTTDISNKRIARNKLLYAEGTGIHDIAQDTKAYVRSLYGSNSPEFEQVESLPFSKK